MSGKIYLIQDDNTLQALSQEAYPNEDLLQTLLAQYPDLLAGEQMNEATPRRWLLVSREVTIPDDEEGVGRLSLDHLFLDQDAFPTLVEVKRSSDTRIRREVEIYFYWYQYKPPFDAEEKRLALLDRLNTIPGVSISQEAIGRRPSFSLSRLQNEAARQEFLDIFEWVINEIQAV